MPLKTISIQADAASWLGTKNASYYCAQSANSRLTAPDCPWVPEDGQSRATIGLYVKNEADI